MLPPAPKHTYVDVYLEEVGASKDCFTAEKRRQADYEAEVKVYRALEKLEESVVVLHGLKYTHQQFVEFNEGHDRRNCVDCRKAKFNIDGECDFVVIGEGYFVILEVKNIPLTENIASEFGGSLEKSQKQAKEMKKYIDNITKKVSDGKCKCFPILLFSAFPTTKREQVHQYLLEDDTRAVLFADDIEELNSWWGVNVKNDIKSPKKEKGEASLDVTEQDKVKEILLAIWCTDKEQCDLSKCSLGRCIADTDQALRQGKITFLSKNRLPNPNIIPVENIELASIDDMNIFKDILEVENLTVEQHEAFCKDENLLIINGPAGSGKTILLLAKIIQLVKSNENRSVVLFTFTSKQSYKRCQKILEKAKITNTALDQLGFYDKEKRPMLESIAESRKENQVVIVNITKPLSQLSQETVSFGAVLVRLIRSNTNIFVDDVQGQLYHFLTSANYLFKRFWELSTTNSVWIACDLTQISVANQNKDLFSSRPFTLEVPPTNIKTLKLNLRNTCDLAGILSKMREQLVECIPETNADQINTVFPLQQPGHFIHGPRTVMHIIEKGVAKENFELIDEIATRELEKLTGDTGSDSFIIGVVSQIKEDDLESTLPCLLDQVKKAELKERVEFCQSFYCYSVEYPAVIVIKDHGPDKGDKAPLHLLMSRARVYCSVVLFTTVRERLLDHQLLCDLLEKLKGDVKMIRYD